jgi:hypothetical protein
MSMVKKEECEVGVCGQGDAIFRDSSGGFLGALKKSRGMLSEVQEGDEGRCDRGLCKELIL